MIYLQIYFRSFSYYCNNFSYTTTSKNQKRHYQSHKNISCVLSLYNVLQQQTNSISSLSRGVMEQAGQIKVWFLCNQRRNGECSGQINRQFETICSYVWSIVLLCRKHGSSCEQDRMCSIHLCPQKVTYLLLINFR